MKPHCWWCTEHYETATVRIPRKEDREKEFAFVGQFCSWECAKAYLLREKHMTQWKGSFAWIRKFAKDMYDQNEVIAAPPRCTLQKFGGSLTIEKFRRPLKEVVAKVAMDGEARTVRHYERVSSVAPDPLSSELRVRRKKPLPGQAQSGIRAYFKSRG